MTDPRNPICPTCGVTFCYADDEFHAFLLRHDLHPYSPSGCGPGWQALLDALVHDLRALGWDGALKQAKEKFGALRFYVPSPSPAQKARIQLAESQSRRTCDLCGRPGETRPLVGSGTWATRCRDHVLLDEDVERDRWRQCPTDALADLDNGVHPVGPALRALLLSWDLEPSVSSIGRLPWALDLPARGRCRIVLAHAGWRLPLLHNLLGRAIDECGDDLVLGAAMPDRLAVIEGLLSLHAEEDMQRHDPDAPASAYRTHLAAAAARLLTAHLMVDDRPNTWTGDAVAVAQGVAAIRRVAWFVVGNLDRLANATDPSFAQLPEPARRGEVAARTVAQLVVLAQRIGCGVVAIASPSMRETVHSIAHVLAAEPALREAVEVVRVEATAEADGEDDLLTCDGRPLRLTGSGLLVSGAAGSVR